MFIYFVYGNFFLRGGWLEIRSRKSKLQNEQIQSIFPFFGKNQLKEMAMEKKMHMLHCFNVRKSHRFRSNCSELLR